MKVYNFILTVVMFFMVCSASAQDEMLEVQVSKDSVYFGNQVKVSFVASNISGNFIAPDFEGFDIISGPFTSSSYSFINGEESRKTTYVYLLQPSRTGMLTIGKAGFKAKGKEFFTREISIYVKENPDGIREDAEKNEQKSRFDNFFDSFGNMDEFFFGTPDLGRLDPQSGQSVPPPKKTYKFKTEKI